MRHNNIISANKVVYQDEIFPELNNRFGYLTHNHEKLIQVVDLIDLEKIYPSRLWDAGFGRPKASMHNFIRTFIAKIIWNMTTTNALIERLAVDSAMRAI